MCHTKQAAMADYYRQFHLYFLKGEDGSELTAPRSCAGSSKMPASPGAGISGNVCQWPNLSCLYPPAGGHCARHADTAPSAAREFPSRRPDPQSFHEDFRRASLPLMKFTNILSFNWRVITLFTALFIGQPWLYFLVELTVFNALLVCMIIRHEKSANASQTASGMDYIDMPVACPRR